jgi:hypothetical protein
VPELQFDVARAFWEIAADVVCAHVQAGDAAPLALCFNDHKAPFDELSGGTGIDSSSSVEGLRCVFVYGKRALLKPVLERTPLCIWSSGVSDPVDSKNPDLGV